MTSTNGPYFSKSASPLASTEEKSIHDNININKSNLEKGLRNRPNQFDLVERGILFSPGKAYSDRMHQLDIAKKRDRLKKKIENRPKREELVSKLILQDESEERQNKMNRIREMLDTSMSNRPGSLELIDKNILQVDRLFASKVHNGDISFPKVCLENPALDANILTPLPIISEVDIQASLNDLTDILSQSSAGRSSSSNKTGAQISCKKTCRVGRFSFHNIEFRPTAQKAREYQQNELLEYEKIQAQHNPSLIKVHSELAQKSRNVARCRSSKFSLLHRLNVHELKSECKQRMISCSNIPKVQLVEKLLPYEAEILESHTSFEQNRGPPPVQKLDHRSSNGEFSPPDFSTPSDLSTPPPYHRSAHKTTHQINQDQSKGSMICHSLSEPIIPDFYDDQSDSISPIHFNLIDHNPPSAVKFFSQHTVPCFEHFNSNNSFPMVRGHSACSHQSCGCLPANGYSHSTHIKPENAFFQSQPDVWNSNNFNGFKIKSELEQSMPLHDNFLHPVFSIDNSSSSIVSENPLPSISVWSNQFSVPIPSEVSAPPVPIDCTDKFELISKQIVLFKNTVDKINHTKNHNSNHIMMQWFFDEYKYVRFDLLKVCNEMVDFINMELKFRRIDEPTAIQQKAWLNDLLDLVNNDFNRSKIDNGHFIDSDLLSSTDLSVSFDGDCAMAHQNNGLEDLDIIDFLDNETNKGDDQTMDNSIFLKDNNGGPASWHISHSTKEHHYNGNDLHTPETAPPFSSLCTSPMSTDDLNHLMDSLLDCTDVPFM